MGRGDVAAPHPGSPDAGQHRTPATLEGGALAMESWHPFRSSAARQEYLAYYDARAQRWPIPSESMLVGTTFGDTFVRARSTGRRWCCCPVIRNLRWHGYR